MSTMISTVDIMGDNMISRGLSADPGVTTADHSVHTFQFGTGFMSDARPDATLPLITGLGPA